MCVVCVTVCNGVCVSECVTACVFFSVCVCVRARAWPTDTASKFCVEKLSLPVTHPPPPSSKSGLVGDKKEVNGCRAEREFIDFGLHDVCLCLSVRGNGSRYGLHVLARTAHTVPTRLEREAGAE